MRHTEIDYVHYIEWMLKQRGKIWISKFQETFPDKLKSLDAAYAVARRIMMAIEGKASYSEHRNHRIFTVIKSAAASNGIECPWSMQYANPGESVYAKLGKRKHSVAVGKTLNFHVKTFRNPGCATVKRDYLKNHLNMIHTESHDIFSIGVDDKFVIARANGTFRRKFGESSFRIICRVAAGDCLNSLILAIHKCGVEPKIHAGRTIEGFDFEDNRTLDDLYLMCSKLNDNLREYYDKFKLS